MDQHLSETQRSQLQAQIQKDISHRAGAIIFDKKLTKCLMVYQRVSQLWGIPKGRRDDTGESYRSCMLREVKEETNLDLKEHSFQYLDFLQIHGVCRIYLVRLLTDKLPSCHAPTEDGKENPEIVSVEWTDLEEAFKRKVNAITRRALQEVRGRLGELRRLQGNFNPDLEPDGNRIVLPPDVEKIVLRKKTYVRSDFLK